MRLAGREVFVIGAGVAGLASAMALAQRGAKVRVFERTEAFEDVGAGIQVGPNAAAVLEALGLRDALEARASFPEAIELRDHLSGRQVARIGLGRECTARYGRPYWHLHRADLIDILVIGAREAGVEIRLGVDPEVISTGPGRPCLQMPDGTEESADLVVAADGLGSKIRTAHFSPAAPRFTGHVAWRGVLKSSDLPESFLSRGASVFMGPGRHLVTYPLRGGALQNVVAVEERREWVAEHWSEPDDPAHLRAAFRGWTPEVGLLLGAMRETFLWGLFDHPPLGSWVRGHLVLTGDACHPTLPFLAQGAAMAIEDAWVLAAELDVAADIETGLRAYEARRKPRATRVQRASARQGRVYHLGAGLRQVVHFGMSALSELWPAALIGQLDWLYGADVVSAQATD